jgi:hypothetical protein
MKERKDRDELLAEARKEIEDKENTLSIKIRDKNYLGVATRLGLLRKYFGTRATISTKIIENTEKRVLMKASIFIDREIISNGYSEQFRGSSPVNKTSALENCETHAVGRALGLLGLTNDNVASAEEMKQVEDEKHQKPESPHITTGLIEQKINKVDSLDQLEAVVNEPQVRKFFEYAQKKKQDDYKKLAALFSKKQKQLTKGKNDG